MTMRINYVDRFVSMLEKVWSELKILFGSPFKFLSHNLQFGSMTKQDGLVYII